uniref:Pathogenesis-related protein 5-like n=1 Tax=Rhabditophanes sp. KR3021 TaxID=114890 RepID=A0AC35TIZ9_9BILA
MDCETGFCKNDVQCGGAGGRPPASLAEFTLGGYGDQDYYDVSLVDGYNRQVTIEPIEGTFRSTGGKYDCKKAGECHSNLLLSCPEPLRHLNSQGHTVGCNSACTKFNTDQYCCRGDYKTPETCKSSTWPVNYPKYFKDNCPTSYSYAYDDEKSTFFCRGSNGRISPDYRVTFC